MIHNMNVSKTIFASQHTEYDVVYTPDVVFAHREHGDLLMQIVSPIRSDLPSEEEAFDNPIRRKFEKWHQEGGKSWEAPPKDTRKFPLIVDCPGSGWAGADGHRHIPYLVALAKAGFVAAGISYRGTYRDDVVFPAAVQDLKEAIRFLKANAAAFHIDPDRVGLLGDSSGGNTVAMTALTDGVSSPLGFPDVRFEIGELPEHSSAVQACCCVYGPVDLLNLVQDRNKEGKKLRPEEAPFPQGVPFEAMEIWQEGYVDDPVRYMKAASPLYYIPEARIIPPFFFIQGDDDQIIPMAQGLRFCEELRAHGGRAEFMKVVAGEHGTGVWSEEMLREMVRFFKAYIG